MRAVATAGLDVDQLFALTLANPLQLFKIAALFNIRQNLEVLGPAGIYAMRTYGEQLLPLLLGLLAIWIAAPFAAAVAVFKRKGVI